MNIYVRKRAKGTERSDLADQDEGVKCSSATNRRCPCAMSQPTWT